MGYTVFEANMLAIPGYVLFTLNVGIGFFLASVSIFYSAIVNIPIRFFSLAGLQKNFRREL